jgi:hypothetical protein
MKYIHYLWIHKFQDYPVILVSEVDDQWFEKRKVEMWRNGKIGWADENSSSKGTILGFHAIGSLEENNSTSEFSGVEITKEEFEIFWNLAVSKG